MDELFLILYEFVCEFLPFFLALVFYGRTQKRRGAPLLGYAYGLLCLFAFYVMGVFHFTGTGTLYNGLRLGLNVSSVNLIPFSDGNLSIPGYLLNMVLFLPLGFLVPLIFRNKDRLLSILGLGLAFSLLIELSQMLSFRATDVDDLIMNTLGAVLGFLIYKVLRKCAGTKLRRWNVPASGLLLAIAVPFLSRFFLYHEFWFSQWIYALRH